MSGGNSAVSRRKFVATLAGGAVVACAAGVESACALSSRSAANAQPVSRNAGTEPEPAVINAAAAPAQSAPPWGLLSPLGLGAAVARGWRIAGLTGVENGSCVLALENERGRSHRVHLCRNDGRPQGLVYTRRIDLVVMNGGSGDLPTEEGFGQAVAAVAHVLAANEASAQHEATVTGLLPHAERIARFASAAQLR
jgi:hypothetical protein